MNKKRRDQINDFANLLRESIGFEQAPYDPKWAVEILNGKISNDIDLLLSDIDAKILKTDDGFEIKLNPNQPLTRLNFSIAHELGHLFLHMGYLIDEEKWKNILEYNDTFYRDYNNTDIEQEYEANEFAAAFLMPKAEFLNIVQNNQVDNRIDIDPIAIHFNVSNDAIANRGKWLGVFQW